MAITLNCPRCTHKNTIDETKAKKAVHCRVCHHLLAPAERPDKSAPKPPSSGEMKQGPPPQAASKSSDPDRERVSKDGPMPPPAKTPAKDERRRSRDDDDRPSRSKNSGGSGMYWLLGGVGLLLWCSAAA
jgi:hypothetical protein